MPHCCLNHLATLCGSKRTDVPMRKQGICPARARLKIMMRESERSSASSTAVNAWPICSILSARDCPERDCVVCNFHGFLVLALFNTSVNAGGNYLRCQFGTNIVYSVYTKIAKSQLRKDGVDFV